MIRVDSASLISGKVVVSEYAGHGVQAQDVPSTGASGPAYLFDDIAEQSAQPTDEMRGEILTWPSAGIFTVNEDSSFSFTGAPDGVHTATYRGYRNGVSYGDFTITMTIGGENTSSTIAYDIGSIDWSVSASVLIGGNSATVSYDIGQIEFAASATVSAPVISSAIGYDIGQISFAVDASVSAAPANVSTAIAYDIGAISFNVAIINGEINNLYGVGSGIVFIEPKSGFSYPR